MVPKAGLPDEALPAPRAPERPLSGVDPLVLGEEGAVTEGLPAPLAPEGLLAAVDAWPHCPQVCGFSALCVARCLTGARGTGSSWLTFRTCGLATVSCFSYGPRGAGCGEVRVLIYRLSGHLLLWRWSSRFCVVVSPGKGSSQGSLACPRAQRLLCRPVLEAHPLRTFQMLLEALRLESFSPSPSPTYAKTPGWNLQRRERACVLLCLRRSTWGPLRAQGERTPRASPLRGVSHR